MDIEYNEYPMTPMVFQESTTQRKSHGSEALVEVRVVRVKLVTADMSDHAKAVKKIIG